MPLSGYILRTVTDAEHWNSSNPYNFWFPASFKIRNCDRAEYIKTHFQAQPPHTVAQASHEIEKLTGIKLSLSASCRDFMRKRLGMKCRKMGVIPSKADPDKQKAFLNDSLEPLL